MPKQKSAVVIFLDEAQQAALKPLLELAEQATAEGKPGIVAAQIFEGELLCGFMPHEQAKAYQAAAGFKNHDGRISSAAQVLEHRNVQVTVGHPKESGS